ncbi:MAG: OmpA family protein [Bacteroidales bacterium]|nr:OmpA family protein [Bacteroidales bacterium]
MKKLLILLGILLFTLSDVNGQSWLNSLGNKAKEKAKEKVEQKVEEKTEEVMEKGFESVEKGVKKERSEVGEEAEESEEAEEGEGEKSAEKKPGTVKNAPQQKKSLESFTQYDFVPGDKILYFEDFSQDAIGDFPALWTSNGSGEVKKVNVADGKWFHMNGTDAVFCYTKEIEFPTNFIMELDFIPDKEYSIDGVSLTFYQEEDSNPDRANDDLYPGEAGIHIFIRDFGWETTGYKIDLDWLNAQSHKNPVVIEEVNHIIIWVQNRRMRIYHQGAKVLDSPSNIYSGVKFNKFRFSGWGTNSYPYVTNIIITTAAPDMRSKLLTEGKIVSYGIYFDSGKDVVKPESYGSVKEIAAVLLENPDVKIKIVGHTDSDGDDALNLDLSKRRAAAVRGFLVKEFGIAADRIETDGMGEQQPVAPNDKPENKAKNRRVEFIKL